MTGRALDVVDLVHWWPGAARPALAGMTFDVATGEVFGLLGPNGAGKTTTQQVLTGLVGGWSGTVEVLGRPLADWGRELYDHVGVSFELPVGWPRLTGREDLAHFAALHGGQVRDPDDLLAAVGLADEGDRPVGTWSKGMRGRLNLARALVADPELVFLDEPTSGLDPTNVAIVRDLVTDMSRTGVTVVLTTHDMATATALCDRVAFVVAGRVVACDSPRALQLAAHERHVVVEHLTPAGPTTTTFPLGRMSQELADLLASGTVERVRTDEPSLDEVFLAVTGGRP